MEFQKKEGFLVKQGIVRKNWKKRWFIMDGTLLYYFRKQKDPYPAGIIQFRDANNIDCVSEPIENHPNCFFH